MPGATHFLFNQKVEPPNIPKAMVAFLTSKQLTSHYCKLSSIRV